MLAVILLCLFTVLGILIARHVFAEEDALIQSWIGGLLGLTGFMWLVVLFSFFFKFGYLSHIFALSAFITITFVIKKYLPKSQSIAEVNTKLFSRYTSYLIFTAGLTILIFALLFTHVIQPKDSGWYGGQSTYGDLPMHLGMVTSISTQADFPPEYSIFPGTRLSYPFLVNSLSSSFYLTGLNLRWSVLVPSMFLVVFLIFGFLLFSHEKLKNTRMTLLSAVFFFFNGGFGIIYFLDKLKTNPENFTRIFTAFYNTPTNFIEKNIYWANIICDLLIPQRTTLAGWTFLFFAVWLLDRAIHTNRKKYYLLAGIITGLMPMIHTHSFLALGIIAATWFIVYFWEQKNKTDYIKKWFFFGVPLIVLSVPQLLFWSFHQVAGKPEGFLSFKFDWVNNNDIWLWFWVKNVGVVFILILPAILFAKKKLLKFYSPALVIFILAELFLFQPNPYDNNKLFYIWYAFSAILVSWFVFNLIDTIPNRYCKIASIFILIAASSISAVLSIGRELVSSMQLFDSQKVEAYQFIEKNTPRDALFISATFHNNPVSALAGRKILCGSGAYLFFHGLNYQKREEDVRRMYQDPIFFEKKSKEYGVDYVYFSSYERSDFKVDSHYYDENYPMVFQTEDIKIYAISERAQKTEQNISASK